MSVLVNIADAGLTAEGISIVEQSLHEMGHSRTMSTGSDNETGTLLLDKSSLTQLGRHFDRLMGHLHNQLSSLEERVQAAVSMEISADADAAIAQYTNLLKEMDELDIEFDRIRAIRDIVWDYRLRAEQLERDILATQVSNPGRNLSRPHEQRPIRGLESSTKAAVILQSSETRSKAPKLGIENHEVPGRSSIVRASEGVEASPNNQKPEGRTDNGHRGNTAGRLPARQAGSISTNPALPRHQEEPINPTTGSPPAPKRASEFAKLIRDRRQAFKEKLGAAGVSAAIEPEQESAPTSRAVELMNLTWESLLGSATPVDDNKDRGSPTVESREINKIRLSGTTADSTTSLVETREPTSRTTHSQYDNSRQTLRTPVTGAMKTMEIMHAGNDGRMQTTVASASSSGFGENLPAFIDVLLDQYLPILRPAKEARLAPGLGRVQWTCTCGAQLYDDFVEHESGALHELEVKLRALNNNTAPSGSSSSRSYGRASSILQGLARWIFDSTPRNTAAPDQSLPLHSGAQLRGNAGISGSTALEVFYVLCCIPSGEMGTKLHQSRLSRVDTDRELMQFLKGVYRQQRNLLSWLTLRTVSKVTVNRFEVDFSHFAQVHPHATTCSESAQCVCLPPVSSIGPEYQCGPAPQTKPRYTPVFGERYLTHYFQSPECVDPLQTAIYNQLPKRTCGQLSTVRNASALGWGVHFEEGWHWRSIYFVVVVLTVTASLIFAVTWTVLRGDLQGAFAVASTWTALGSLLLGYMAVRS